MICLQQKQRYFDFINEQLNADFDRLKARCISSVDEHGTIFGVVMFDRFTTYACELSIAMAVPRGMTREFIKSCFDYVFNTCGKIRITTIVREDNEKSLKLTRGLGFVDEARFKQIYGDKDGIVFRMLKNECRWIGTNHG